MVTRALLANHVAARAVAVGLLLLFHALPWSQPGFSPSCRAPGRPGLGGTGFPGARSPGRMGLGAAPGSGTAAVPRDVVGRGPVGAIAMSRIAARSRPAIDPEEDSYATRRTRPD